MLLRTLAPRTTKPEVIDALGTPVNAIAGTQPSELTFAVQYVTGLGTPA